MSIDIVYLAVAAQITMTIKDISNPDSTGLAFNRKKYVLHGIASIPDPMEIDISEITEDLRLPGPIGPNVLLTQDLLSRLSDYS